MFDPLIWLFAVVSLVALALAWVVGKALRQGALWAWYLVLAVHSIITIWGIKDMTNVEYWDNPEILLLATLPWTAVSAFVVGTLLHPTSLRWRRVGAERRATSRGRTS